MNEATVNSAEVLRLIQQTAVEAQTAKVLELPGDGRKKYVQVGGTLTEKEIPPGPRNHQVRSLADLVAYAKSCDKGVVWHSYLEVVLVIDDADRRDLVTFQLTRSRQLSVLTGLDARKNEKPLRQDELIRMLRFDLGVDTAVLAKFRKLDWTNAQNSTADLQHGKDRMGKQIEAACQGTDGLPETLRLSVPVYEDAGEREPYVVEVGIEVDATNQVFYVQPLAGEMQRVWDLAQQNLRGRLDAGHKELGAAVDVYFGSPGSADSSRTTGPSMIASPIPSE